MDRFNTRKRKAQAEQYEEEKPTKKLKQTGLSFANSSTSSSNNRSSVTNPQNCIRIVSWNVNGIRATVNKQGFQDYMQREFDIIAFNETKLQDSHVRQFEQTFSQFPYQRWSCSQAKKGYSGVAILSKIEPLSVTEGINIRKHDQEGRCVTMEFDKFYLVATYIPNAGQQLKNVDYRTNQWDVDFKAYLLSLHNTGKGVVWMGDLNVIHQDIDIYNIKGKEKQAGCSPQERRNFGLLLDDGFIDTYRHLYPNERKYSWYSVKNPNARKNNYGWRLDYAVVSDYLIDSVKDSLIHDDVMGSDHHPIEIILEFPEESQEATS